MSSIYRDEPPTDPGWYWVDCSGIAYRSVPCPPERIGWLKQTGWNIPGIGFGLGGGYLVDLGVQFGPRVPDAKRCAEIERVNNGN